MQIFIQELFFLGMLPNNGINTPVCLFLLYIHPNILKF